MRIFAAFAALVGGAAGAGWLAAGDGGAVVATAAMLLAGASLYAYASECVLRLAGAYPVSGDVASELRRLVERLAAQADTLPRNARDPAGTGPRLYWLPGDAPNVLATGRGPAHAAIALTPDLPALLDRDELAGLLARELACLTRGDARLEDVAAALAGGLMLVARWPDQFQPPAESGSQNSGQWVRRCRAWVGAAWRMLLARIAAAVVRAVCSAARVHVADAAGAQMLDNPLPLARALAKLAAWNGNRPLCGVSPGIAHEFVVAPFVEEALQRLFCMHPPVAARVRRLTEQALEPTVVWTRELAGHRKLEVRGVQSEYRKSAGTM